MEQLATLQPFLRELQDIENDEGLLFEVIRRVLLTVHVDFLISDRNLFLSSLVDPDTFSRDKRPLLGNILQRDANGQWMINGVVRPERQPTGFHLGQEILLPVPVAEEEQVEQEEQVEREEQEQQQPPTQRCKRRRPTADTINITYPRRSPTPTPSPELPASPPPPAFPETSQRTQPQSSRDVFFFKLLQRAQQPRFHTPEYTNTLQIRLNDLVRSIQTFNLQTFINVNLFYNQEVDEETMRRLNVLQTIVTQNRNHSNALYYIFCYIKSQIYDILSTRFDATETYNMMVVASEDGHQFLQQLTVGSNASTLVEDANLACLVVHELFPKRIYTTTNAMREYLPRLRNTPAYRALIDFPLPEELHQFFNNLFNFIRGNYERQ